MTLSSIMNYLCAKLKTVTMKRLAWLSVMMLVMIASCSKVKKRVRKIHGTWDVASYTDRWVYTGDCGVPFGYFNVFTVNNIGTIDFTKDDPYWPGQTDDDAHSGEWDLSYTYVDPQTGSSYPVTNNMKFDWYILDDRLVIHNPEQFVFEVYSLEDFSKKDWEVSFANDQTSLGCTYQETFYTLNKQ